MIKNNNNTKKRIKFSFLTVSFISFSIFVCIFVLLFATGGFNISARSAFINALTNLNTRLYFKLRAGVFFISALFASLLIGGTLSGKIDNIPEKISSILSKILTVAFPILIFSTIAIVKAYDYIFVNFLIVVSIYIMFFSISQSSSVAAIVTTVVLTAFTVINELVISSRGTALALSDVMATTTAITVAGNYDINITFDMMCSLVSALFIILTALNFPFRFKKKHIPYTVPVCIMLTVAFIFSSYRVINKTESNTNNFNKSDLSNNKGVLYNITERAIHYKINPPQGYSGKKVNELLASFGKEKGERTPNIIVIADESFADMRELYDIETNMPVLPFFDKIKAGQAPGYFTTGHMVPSVYGGSTCNTEFELLTGLTMTFLPKDSFPFLQYINKKIPTFIVDEDSKLYSKTYIHPYIASNWNRSTLYKLFGFDKFLSGTDFVEDKSYTENYKYRFTAIDYPGVDKERGYISDRAVFEKIKELYESKPKDKKLLTYAMTMQNHGDYNYNGENFSAFVRAEGASDSFNQYITLSHITDEAVEDLIEYFSNVDEDTVIAFVGDHEPNVSVVGEGVAMKKVVPEEIHDYYVPFFVWTNYETENKEDMLISANYFSLIVKEKANIGLNGFDLFRKKLMESYPVITSHIIIDKDNKTFVYDSENVPDTLKEYLYIEYKRLFDNI